MEIEIKLIVYPGDLPAVLKAVGEVASVVEPPAPKRLESRYYDTPSGKLRSKGMTLRVRRVGQKFIQTVKTKGDGLFTRGEWEQPVASFAPELEGNADLLTETFATDVERNCLVACFPAWRAEPSRIELAMDTGVIRAGRQELPVSEVELELIEGEPADLFDLGARLAEMVPLQLSIDAKSARGFRLAEDSPPPSVKADKLEFPDDVSLEE
ncbi:MAG: inorganic triphosphatase, partial [Sphingomonadales bacterium]